MANPLVAVCFSAVHFFRIGSMHKTKKRIRKELRMRFSTLKQIELY